MQDGRPGVGGAPRSAPAGWYPTDAGLRYWDGRAWTDHLVPSGSSGRPGAGPSPGAAAAHGRGPGPAAWCGWGGLVLVTFLGGLTGGTSGFFGTASGYVLVVAVVGLVRGRVRWARLRGRATAGVALAGAIVLGGIGGATAEPPAAPVTSSTGASRATSPSPSESPTTASPSPSASPTTSPTPTPPAAPAPRPSPSVSPTPTPTRTAAKGTALAALAALPVKGRAPRTGYDRDRFGQAWADVDRNGCDTRNDVLRRDLDPFTLRAGTHGCLVLSGRLGDPYTGRRIDFVRGPGTSTRVQIDHVVALSDAWQKGAQQLDSTTRTAFANDPLNLLAVDGPTNQRKGDGDAATWLPPQKSFRCAYVARQVAVKRAYHLWVTAAERDAVERILSTCPTQKLPTSRAVPLGGGKVVDPTPTPARTTTPPKPPTSSTDPRFGTCKAAIAAGYGPYHRGQDPEYDWYRDADSDGIVCER